jgi:hypothetical protein
MSEWLGVIRGLPIHTLEIDLASGGPYAESLYDRENHNWASVCLALAGFVVQASAWLPCANEAYALIEASDRLTALKEAEVSKLKLRRVQLQGLKHVVPNSFSLGDRMSGNGPNTENTHRLATTKCYSRAALKMRHEIPSAISTNQPILRNRSAVGRGCEEVGVLRKGSHKHAPNLTFEVYRHLRFTKEGPLDAHVTPISIWVNIAVSA